VAEGAIGGNPVTGSPDRPPRPRGRLRALRRSERGTALVEFALIAPLLFLLLFGIIDFGRALNYYNQVTQLAGQTARAAAVNRMADGTVITSTSALQSQIVNQYTAQPQLKAGESVCIMQVPANVGDAVKVTVAYKFQFLPLVGAIFGGATLTLRSTQTERAETVPPSYAAVDQTGNLSSNNPLCKGT
jgi:Flp pilus assembly protein TadG